MLEAVDVWSNSSRCRQESIYLTQTWCLYFIIIALDIVITLRFSINCSTVICSPIVLFAILREASSATYGPGSIFHHISFRSTILRSFTFRSINQKCQKYFIFCLSSLSDLTFASDCEGIDNPFITLGASCLMVCAGIGDLCVVSYWIDTLIL